MTDAEKAKNAQLIREAAHGLARHPRFRGKMFGPVQALEVLVQLEKFLASQPRPVAWPRGEEQGQ